MCLFRNKMKYQMELLLYLDNRRLLEDMKNECQSILAQFTDEIIRKFPPVRYFLYIDVMNLLDYSSELGNYLLNEPLIWQQLCNEILFACLKSIDNDYNQVIGLSQVATVIRLKCLPNPLTINKQQTYKGVVAYTGLLIDISQPSNYVYHTVWSCPEQCEGNEVVLHFIPKSPPKCFMCKSVLFENSGLRRCGEQVTVTVILKNELFCKQFIIRDDLITLLKLGTKYEIHAVVLKKMISVWSIEEIIILPAPMSSPIPRDIKKLYATCNGLPWKFIYCLASVIGFNITPLNFFMNLKINLLLSLASVKANITSESPILNCLASGYDTGYVSLIMNYAAQLADRHVAFGTSNTATTSALLAASGGVCVLTLPFHVYGQKQCHSILSILETKEITHNMHNSPLKCAVWGHVVDKKNDFCNVGSVFLNICRGDYGEYVDELAEYLLQQAIQPVEECNEEKQSLRDLSHYIDLVAAIKVKIDEDAEHLLRSYFLAARKERLKIITIGTMNSLVTVCITIAKLCRRSIANINDAVFSIWIHVSDIPEPRFAPSEILETPADINKLQDIIEQFQNWLMEFTGVIIKVG